MKYVTRLSYVITAQLLADEICPERKTVVNNICLSRGSVAGRVGLNEISNKEYFFCDTKCE